ncbi:MAG: NIPSNAP family protein [Burkholderiales bacterium]
MIYELRFYDIAAGRLADAHGRFIHHLPALFARHGVHCVGRWSATTGRNGPRFVYLMAFRDYAEREAAWDSFYGDAEWWKVRAATNGASELVERYDLFFLKPNAAWKPPAVAPDETLGGQHEVILQQVSAGQNAGANEFLTTTYLPVLQAFGARPMGVFDMAAGTNMPALVIFLAWPDAARRQAAMQAIESDERLVAAWRAQREKNGRAVFERSEVTLLEPAAYWLPLATLGRAAG